MHMVSSLYTERPSPRFDHQTVLHMFQESSIRQYLMAKCGLPSIEVHFQLILILPNQYYNYPEHSCQVCSMAFGQPPRLTQISL